MEAQWLPNNIKKGFLRDVTKQYGADATVHVDQGARRPRLGRERGQGSRASTPTHQAKGEFGLDIVPAKVALEKLKAAPDGTVMVVVRADRPNLVTRISHVGFLVHKKKGVFLRHASRTFGKVVDEDLEAYLGRNLGYAKWTVDGFALFEVTRVPLPTRVASGLGGGLARKRLFLGGLRVGVGVFGDLVELFPHRGLGLREAVGLHEHLPVALADGAEGVRRGAPTGANEGVELHVDQHGGEAIGAQGVVNGRDHGKGLRGGLFTHDVETTRVGAGLLKRSPK